MSGGALHYVDILMVNEEKNRDSCFLVLYLFKYFVLLPLAAYCAFFHLLCGMLSEVLCAVCMLCFQTTLLRMKKGTTVEISCHIFIDCHLLFCFRPFLLVYMRCPALCG